jgi:hypothetical protein
MKEENSLYPAIDQGLDRAGLDSAQKAMEVGFSVFFTSTLSMGYLLR